MFFNLLANNTNKFKNYKVGLNKFSNKYFLFMFIWLSIILIILLSLNLFISIEITNRLDDYINLHNNIKQNAFPVNLAFLSTYKNIGVLKSRKLSTFKS